MKLVGFLKIRTHKCSHRTEQVWCLKQNTTLTKQKDWGWWASIGTRGDQTIGGFQTELRRSHKIEVGGHQTEHRRSHKIEVGGHQPERTTLAIVSVWTFFLSLFLATASLAPSSLHTSISTINNLCASLAITSFFSSRWALKLFRSFRVSKSTTVFVWKKKNNHFNSKTINLLGGEKPWCEGGIIWRHKNIILQHGTCGCGSRECSEVCGVRCEGVKWVWQKW